MTTILDWLIDLWVKADAWATTYGPGLTLATAGWLAWRGLRRLHDRITDRRGLAALRREAADQARLDAAIRRTSGRHPRHGTDTDLLHACTDIWNQPTREEKP
jgi:hypothetical protein